MDSLGFFSFTSLAAATAMDNVNTHNANNNNNMSFSNNNNPPSTDVLSSSP
jgi:hypothetical protein